MSKLKVAFQGELGAYSHIACEALFPGADIKTCPTFEETFKTAHQDDSYRIVIPIENSLAGRVADIHYLLPKYKLQIYAEHYQKVEHNLLVKENTEIKDIKYVRSHAQAIDQCQKIISKNKFKTIEDETNNVTRFIIMGKSVQQPSFEKNKKYITSCIFRLKSIPAALYKCLGGFATNQVNMTKLESFSVKNTFDQTNFYLDLEGHIEDTKVQKALEELGFHTESLDILGVYEASKFRQKK